MNLTQLVDTPTHQGGHILDLTITRNNEQPISDIQVKEIIDSDHFSVLSTFKIMKPKLARKVIEYRKIKAINTNDFKQDIKNAKWNKEHSCLNALLDNYNNNMKMIMDKHAPIKRKCVVIRDESPWINDQIIQEI